MNELTVGSVSADGAFYWDGTEWASTLSPDGAWTWNGAAWVPAGPIFGSGAIPQYVSPKTMGLWVSVFMGLSGAIAVVEALFLTDIIVFTGRVGAAAFTYTVGAVGLAIYAVASTLFLIWFHRSYRNLAALGARDLRFSSFWSVGWWLVPIAALWKPYRATVEIWKASDPAAGETTALESRDHAHTSGLVRAWWAAWLGSLLMFNIAAFTASDPSTIYWQSALSAVTTVLAAVLTILVVTSIGARQDDRWRWLVSMVATQVMATSPVQSQPNVG